MIENSSPGRDDAAAGLAQHLVDLEGRYEADVANLRSEAARLRESVATAAAALTSQLGGPDAGRANPHPDMADDVSPRPDP